VVALRGGNTGRDAVQRLHARHLMRAPERRAADAVLACLDEMVETDRLELD